MHLPCICLLGHAALPPVRTKKTPFPTTFYQKAPHPNFFTTNPPGRGGVGKVRGGWGTNWGVLGGGEELGVFWYQLVVFFWSKTGSFWYKTGGGVGKLGDFLVKQNVGFFSGASRGGALYTPSLA